jgi:hypothetical protein
MVANWVAPSSIGNPEATAEFHVPVDLGPTQTAAGKAAVGMAN